MMAKVIAKRPFPITVRPLPAHKTRIWGARRAPSQSVNSYTAGEVLTRVRLRRSEAALVVSTGSSGRRPRRGQSDPAPRAVGGGPGAPRGRWAPRPGGPVRHGLHQPRGCGDSDLSASVSRMGKLSEFEDELGDLDYGPREAHGARRPLKALRSCCPVQGRRAGGATGVGERGAAGGGGRDLGSDQEGAEWAD